MSQAVSDFYPVKAAACFGAIMLIALARVHAHHPFSRFGPANQVTAVRALLVALVAACIGEAGSTRVATAAVAAAAMSTILDGADGWLARRSGMASAFGARFDMEVDALAQARQLPLCRAGGEEQRDQDRGFAHQSITPDQSGSEPPWGVVNCRGSAPSSATR